MTRVIGALIALAFACAPAIAAVNEWTPIGPSGGYVRGLAFHPSAAGVVYASVGERFYVSTDNGTSWTPRPRVFADTLTGLAVDPTNGDVLYVSEVNYGLWRSADRGETFTFLGPSDRDAGVIRLVIDGNGTRLVAANSRGSLLKSDDGGAHWANITPVPTPPLAASYFVALAIDPTNRDVLYAGMIDGGVFKSSDGGTTWTQLMIGPATGNEYSIVIDPADHNHVLLTASSAMQSYDAGANWSLMFGAAGPVAAFDPQDSNRLYIGSISNAVFRSADGGVQWDLFNTDNGLTCGWFNHLFVDPRNSQHLIGGGDEEICASVDGGATWTSASAGILATTVETLRVAPGTQRRILVGLSPGSAFVSSTSDGPWTPLNRTYLGTSGAPSGISVVAFDRTAPTDKWLVGIRTGGVRVTSDGGANWQFGDSNAPFYDLIAVASADTFIAATHFGVYRSTNGGVNWEATTTPSEFRDFSAVAVDPANPAILYAGAGWRRGAARGVAKSVDGGLTWTTANTGIASEYINRLAVHPTNSNVIYAAGSGGLNRSTDAGHSWVTLTTLDPHFMEIYDVAIDPSSPNILYAASALVERSVDGGASWETIFSRVGSVQQARHVALDTINPSIVYAGTLSHGVQAMEIAPDLILSATPPTASVTEGTTASITYELRNQGPFTASSVTLTATHSQAAASTTITSTRGNCTRIAGIFNCSIGALASGAVATVTFNFTPALGDFTVNAAASAYERDPARDNNASQVAVNVTSAPSQPNPPSTPNPPTNGGGGGSTGLFELFVLLAFALRRALARTDQPIP